LSEEQLSKRDNEIKKLKIRVQLAIEQSENLKYKYEDVCKEKEVLENKIRTD